MAQTAARIAICLNKVDRLTPDEIREAMAFIRPRVAALAHGGHPRLRQYQPATAGATVV